MKPILFNTEMVQAILEGKKTTTRRIIKDVDNNYTYLGSDKQKSNVSFSRNTTGLSLKIKIPYKAGDILYVRETWQISNPMGDFARDDMTAEYVYKAGYAKGKRIPITKDKEKNLGVWKPSIHMPKAAARIFLKVTNVRIERLQNITEDGIKAEGITCDKEYEEFKNAAESNCEVKFATLWDSTVNKKDLDQYGFNSNPYVWVIEFERCDIDGKIHN
ncbi:hypothetical protein [Clostridium botulinum]|uniref:hypothetical protein n=1 Tax=Clostridium botulinum TaxID=1491 RepID=UPI0007743414|nr:hypothetical protein [Clostridium botulinum]